MSSPSVGKILPPDPEYLLNEMLQQLYLGLKSGNNSVEVGRPELVDVADLLGDKESVLVFSYTPKED